MIITRQILLTIDFFLFSFQIWCFLKFLLLVLLALHILLHFSAVWIHSAGWLLFSLADGNLSPGFLTCVRFSVLWCVSECTDQLYELHQFLLLLIIYYYQYLLVINYLLLLILTQLLI